MQVLQSLLSALQGIVTVLGRIIEAISNEFNLGLNPESSQIIAALLLIGFVFRLIFWPMANASSFKPQTITMPTSKSPWQIVWGDVSGCLTAIVVVALVLAGLFALSQRGP